MDNNKNISNKALQLYFKEIERYAATPLSEERERELFKKIKREDDNARQQITNKYLMLVARIAERYLSRAKKLDLLDLIQEGNLGFFKAIDLYDYKSDYKFSVFALIIVSYAIKKSLIDESETINKNPMHDFARKYKENLPKILADKSIRTHYYFPPTLYKNTSEEILLWEDLTGDEKRVVRLSEPKGYKKKIVNFVQDNFSEMLQLISKTTGVSEENTKKEINKIIKEGADSDLNKTTISKASNEEIDNARKIYRNILQHEIRRHLAEFSPQEQKVLSVKFGLDDGIMHTLEDIGEEFGITREEIRQLQERVFRIIKKDASLRKKLWAFKQ